MNKSNRKFSIPYNPEINPALYLNLVNEYKSNIDHIFLGLPSLANHLDSQYSYNNICGDIQTNNVFNFLLKTKNVYKRIITYNNCSINSRIEDVFAFFENKIYPLIEYYSIDGFILTNFALAKKLKQDFPNLELHTSCNGFQWNIRQMEYWRNIGVELFNPPREAARTPSMLKEMYEHGFKLKVLVNECCIYGCAESLNHACAISEWFSSKVTCMNYDISNALRTNLYLPRWLDYIDEYVEVYKLSGRKQDIKFMKSMFDAYILQYPVKYINDYAVFGNENIINMLSKKGIFIEDALIPDELKWCESKFCDKTCFICSDIIKEILNKAGIDNL